MPASTFLISVGALGVAFVVAAFLPSGLIWMTPLVMVVNALLAGAVALLVSILIVYVRDLRNAIPVVLQPGLFATPVVYPLEQIPVHFRLAYSFLNPMAPVIDSYRCVILYGGYPQWGYPGAGALTPPFTSVPDAGKAYE